MRVVFMGTPEFAVWSLKEVVRTQEVVGIVTQKDKATGRGQKMQMSPVKAYAQGLSVPLFQPERLAEPSVIASLLDLKPDSFVVVAYGQKIPKELLAYPCINVHGSLLPKYRGAAPVHRAIVEGEKITGVTTMYLSEEWDAGDMILQEAVEIDPMDTAGSLHDKLMVVGAKLLGETLRQIEEKKAPRTPQDPSLVSYAYRITKEEGRISWDKSALEIANLVRGMNPWPVAYTLYQGEPLKVYEACALMMDVGVPSVIEDIGDEGILVGTKEGALLLKTLQRPGGKRISGRDLANGLHLKPGDAFL